MISIVNKMTFQKGQSGNPSGRPKKVVEDAKHSLLLDLFDDQAEREIITNMLRLAKSKNITTAPSSINAATWLWDRKYGKVKEHMELSGFVDLKGYANVSPDDFDNEATDPPDSAV